jgi:hypothetical protein
MNISNLRKLILVSAICFILQRSPLRAQVQYQDTNDSGYMSTALGEDSTASGDWSLAIGLGTTAGGQYCTAFGLGTTATQEGTTAFGINTIASGCATTASGYGTTASGGYSSASGFYTKATAFESFVVGGNNLGTGSDGSASNSYMWVPTDPIFEVGNGTMAWTIRGWDSVTQGDAFVVYKNGNTKVSGTLIVSGTTTSTFSGPVNVAPGGDIPMFSGN